MDWSPQIIVKAEDSNSIPTSITALKTFETGFPDHKATVHCIGNFGYDLVKEWVSSGGHKLIHHITSTKRSQLVYEITRRTRLPIALIVTLILLSMAIYESGIINGRIIIDSYTPLQ